MTRFVSVKRFCNVFVLGFAGLLPAFSASLSGDQEQQSNVEIRSEVKHIGTAEVRTVTPTSLFVPNHQPEVYWHDSDWNIDLVSPASENNPSVLSIRSSTGKVSALKLPTEFEQINSILRAPGDKAIVIEESHTGTGGFAIVDLGAGTTVDKVGIVFANISPNRRFILYQNWFPPHAETYENIYHLYDTMKSPLGNVCGYMNNDPKHEDLNDGMRGFQVYPQESGQTDCNGPENDDDDNMATNFTWAEDSTTIVFADVKSGVMSLVLVTMPTGLKDLPKTSVYTLTGTEDVCAGNTDAVGENNCDYHVIQSLDWEEGAVKAVFHHQFGAKFNLEVTIPISKFVPISK